jgi:hypothetical protein
MDRHVRRPPTSRCGRAAAAKRPARGDEGIGRIGPIGHMDGARQRKRPRTTGAPSSTVRWTQGLRQGAGPCRRPVPAGLPALQKGARQRGLRHMAQAAADFEWAGERGDRSYRTYGTYRRRTAAEAAADDGCPVDKLRAFGKAPSHAGAGGLSYCSRRRRRLASSRSNASGSNSPTHSIMSSWSGSAGSRTASAVRSYPQTPPMSSGGQARSPATQTG